jgi:hypothetical protein
MVFANNKLVSCLLALGLVACANVAELREKVEARGSCCASMSEFKYEALDVGRPISFVLDEQAPVFSFDTGKSYFKAFSLAPNAERRTLRISSRPTGSIGFETRKFSQSFCARAVFLDEAFKQLSALDTIPNYAQGFWSSAFVSLFEIPVGARYVVLLTNPRTFAYTAVRYTSGGGYMVGNAFVFERGGEAIHHPCGPIADAAAEIF